MIYLSFFAASGNVDTYINPNFTPMGACGKWIDCFVPKLGRNKTGLTSENSVGIDTNLVETLFIGMLSLSYLG